MAWQQVTPTMPTVKHQITIPNTQSIMPKAGIFNLDIKAGIFNLDTLILKAGHIILDILNSKKP
jgi:hypothetical protein